MDLDIQRAFAYTHILICFILAISSTSEKINCYVVAYFQKDFLKIDKVEKR